MSGSRCLPQRAWLLAWSAAWLGLLGCSGTSFSSDGLGGTSAHGGTDSAGTSAGGVGAGASGGSSSAGDSTNGGTPDIAGSAGSAGSGVTPACDCPAGRYCREGSTDCFDCTELNRLRFTTPERLATLSDNGQGSNFPRVGVTTTDLVYVFNGTGLRYTTDSSTSAGSSVKGTEPEDKGPLLLSENVAALPTLGMGFNFLFDRKATARQLYVGVWSAGAQTMLKLPPPFNADQDDYSIAVAPHAGANSQVRAFWMSTRGDKLPRLYTAFLQEGTTEEEVALRLAKDRQGSMDEVIPCPTTDQDLAPWVTGDGKTLLFSHTRVDGNCAVVTAQKRDLYTTLLQPANGQPPADADAKIIPATPINDVNSAGDDIEPSFSADMCELYFASNRDGNFAVYRAHRR